MAFTSHATAIGPPLAAPDERDASGGAHAAPSPAALPTLRADVALVDTGTPGHPAWVLHDPLRARYVRLGWLELELLARFPLGEPGAIVAAVNRESTLHATTADLERLVRLLEDEELVRAEDEDARARLARHADARRRPALARLFHASLHLRRSLIDPEPLLDVLARLCRPVLDRPRASALLLGSAAASGLLLLSRHTAELGATLERWLSPAGAVALVATLVLTNVVHELGHGIAAAHVGCRVRRMGVALIFLIPVAWCDTSDAWRLRGRRERLAIDAGGLVIEAVLAVAALWAWLLLPDGPARALALFVAAGSLASTLLINLNPFMKFDGYFLLADALGVENLSARAFATLRVAIRRTLVGSDEPWPADTSRKARRALVGYALATAVYRLFLYLAIAWMVYAFWFKALGLVMAATTLVMLLLRPVLLETRACLDVLRRRGVGPRAIATLATLGLAALAFVVPLPRALSAPAVLAPADSARIYAPRPARIETLHVETGAALAAGDPVAVLVDPALEHEIARNRLEREALLEARRAESGRRAMRERSRRGAPADEPSAGAAVATTSALARQDAALEALLRERDTLTLRAPIDGEVVRVDERLAAGLWIDANAVVAEIATSGSGLVRAYVGAESLARVDALFDGETPAAGAARFVPADGGAPRELRPIALAPDATARLVDPMLAVPNGGEIAVVPLARDPAAPASGDDAHRYAPLGSLHVATFLPLTERRSANGTGASANGLADEDANGSGGDTARERSAFAEERLERERAGHVRLAAAPASLAARAFDRLYGAFLRESGF